MAVVVVGEQFPISLHHIDLSYETDLKRREDAMETEII